MSLGEYIRNKGYFILDRLRKETLASYVHELEKFDQVEQPYSLIQEKLSHLLSIAQKTTVFYQGQVKGVDLLAYPVIAKKQLREKMDQFLSSKHQKSQLVKVSTSGSYGTPLVFYLTKQKKKRQLAEVIHYTSKSGYRIGVNHGFFMSSQRKSNFRLWLQNETFFASKHLDQDFLERGRKKLKANRIKYLIGFPSAINLLAQYCTDQGDSPKDFAVDGVITCSENLSQNHRDTINTAFGCKIHSRYGTEELGVLACQYTSDSGFAINNCNYIVEVLHLDNDQHVEPGQIGRVVVTDLHSEALPLIRYETGDLAVLGKVFEENKTWARSLDVLSGRTVQILYDTIGNKVYPLYFDNIMDNYPYFAQYQLIQETEKEFVLNLVPNMKIQISKDINVALVNEFQKWLGKDAEIKLVLVNDIVRLPSGKRPYIINNLKNNV